MIRHGEEVPARQMRATEEKKVGNRKKKMGAIEENLSYILSKNISKY